MASSNWSSVEAFFKFLSNFSSIFMCFKVLLHSRSGRQVGMTSILSSIGRLWRVPRSAVCYSTLIQSDSQWVLQWAVVSTGGIVAGYVCSGCCQRRSSFWSTEQDYRKGRRWRRFCTVTTLSSYTLRFVWFCINLECAMKILWCGIVLERYLFNWI